MHRHEHPLVVIRPQIWSWPDLAAVWQYRELLLFLTWRDIQVRYKQTMLGASWAILQPLITMGVFTVLFGRLAKMPSDGIPYPLFAYAGLLPWTFFSSAIASGSNSLVANANLITKVYFPRIIIPMAAIAARLADFVVSLALMVVLMVYYQVPLSLSWLLMPVQLLLLVLLAMGVGIYLSTLNVRYRDIGVALPFLVQMWMFATPVIYPLSLVPPQWQKLVCLNPLTGIVEGFRDSLFGRPMDPLSAGIAVVATLAIVAVAFVSFARTEQDFADLV